MGKNEIIIPDRSFALDLLRKVRLSFPVRQHSISVANKAVEIANKITKAKVNVRLVEIGGSCMTLEDRLHMGLSTH